MRKVISSGLLCILINISALCFGQAGRLDPSFSGDGRVVTNFPGGGQPAVNARAFGVVVRPNARIVAAGFAGNDFALAQYNVNGNLSAVFSGDGRVTTNIAGNDQARAVVLQPDGKVVAAGFASLSGQRVFALARYNANGTLDTDFDGDGRVTTNFNSGRSAEANAVALQSDGKIVAAGFVTVDGIDRFALARYNTNGTLDTTFGRGDSDGIDGVVTTDFSTSIPNATNAQANGVAIDPQGRIVVAGFVTVNDIEQFILVRYDTTGSTNTSQLATFGGIRARANALVLDNANNKIIAVGFAGNNFALAQFNATNLSIGVSDQIITPLGANSQANAVVVQSDSKIIAAGFRGNNFAVVRYNADGRSLDTTFGNNGRVFTDFGGTDQGQAAAIDSAGRLVVAGFSVVNNRGRFAVARYLLDSGTAAVTITSATPPDESTICTGTAENLEGTASANSTVTVFDSNDSGEFIPMGTAQVNDGGQWKFTAEKLALGKHILVAGITNSDGQIISNLSNTVTLTVVERTACNSAWLQAISNKYCKNCS